MKIVLTIQDTDTGGVRIDSQPLASELVDKIPGGLGATSSASMYALGMMTWAAKRSREMGSGRSNLIELPPGVRLS